jgi:hypothetical protein
MNKLENDFFEAILENDPEKIEKTLIDGANPFELYEGIDALTYAVNKGKLQAFEYLLEVTKGGKELDRNVIGKRGESILTYLLKDPFSRVEFTTSLIAAGADVNLINRKGESPLLMAIQFEKNEEAKVLLEAGADFNYVLPELGLTPFMLAAKNGNVEMIELLLERGVDVNQVNNYGTNALNQIIESEAIRDPKGRENLLKTISLLIDKGINVNNVAKSGLTPLWSAIKFNSVASQVMDLLVDAGADIYAVHDILTDKKQSFAHKFLISMPEAKKIKVPKTEEIRLIEIAPVTRAKILDNLKMGLKNEYGNSLEVLVAIQKWEIPENVEKVMGILKNIDLNQSFYTQENAKTGTVVEYPLLTALSKVLSEEQLLEVIDDKKSKGEELNIIADSAGVLPDHQPINQLLKNGHLKALRKICDGKKLDTENIVINLPKGKTVMLQNLLNNFITDPKLNNIKLKLKKTKAVLDAIEENKKNNVKSELLKETSEEDIKKIYNAQEKAFNTLSKLQEEVANNLKFLGFKFEGKNVEGTPYVFVASAPDIIEVFEKMGASITEKAQNGDCILVNAINSGHVEALGYLVQKYKENQVNMDGFFNQLAYHDLSKRTIQSYVEHVFGHIEAVFKGEKEEDPIVIPFLDKKDEDGNTALMTSIANGYPYYASQLIKWKADVNTSNNEGETPIMHAIGLENEGLVKLLLESGADLNAKTNSGLSVDDILEDVEDERIAEVIEAFKNNNMESVNNKIIMKKR